jgi:hypothetical protein
MARANKIIAAALQVDPDAGEWSEDRMHCALLRLGKWNSCIVKDNAISDTRLVHVHTAHQAQAMANILNAEGVK